MGIFVDSIFGRFYDREMPDEQPFWKTKSFDEMSRTEWDSLCDGCGRCCLTKAILSDDNGQPASIVGTCISCRLLDVETGFCSNFPERVKHVPECMVFTPENIRSMYHLPPTCGYRIVAQGDDLPDWHPLKSGDQRTVRAAGVSVAGRGLVNQQDASGRFEDYIVRWPFQTPEQEAAMARRQPKAKPDPAG